MTNQAADRALRLNHHLLDGAVCKRDPGIDRAVVRFVIAGCPADQTADARVAEMCIRDRNGSPGATDVIALKTETKPSTWAIKYWAGIRDGLFIFLLIMTLLLVLTLLTSKLRKRKRP